MRTTQKLKQQIFKEVQASGLFKEVQSKLKTEVLNLVDKQSNSNKKNIGFQYEHPLLNKLRKYPLTSLCLDLMQEFLQSFKFKYTLSVFKKEINRDININRSALANNFQIQMNNPETQAVLLSLVSQLVSGDIKINSNKPKNAFINTNQVPSNNNLRVNNFVGNKQTKIPQQTAATNFNKKSNYGLEQPSSSSNNDKSKLNISNSNSSAQPQKPSSISVNDSKDISQKPSSILESSFLKASQNQVKGESQLQPAKEDNNKKGKKKKEVQKPPEGATDLMGDLMSKFRTKDNKLEEQQKKILFQQKRAFSEQKAKKVVDPSESGTNKIRGVSTGKMSSFMNKFLAPTAKNDSYVQEQMDQFQQSKDSTRKNPLYSSTESGLDKSGYYDISVDSNAINEFEYVQKAKKQKKK